MCEIFPHSELRVLPLPSALFDGAEVTVIVLHSLGMSPHDELVA